MKIIIAGLGLVGTSLAQNLSSENHDITCIDIDKEIASQLEDSYDVLGVCGNCASIRLLKDVGIDKTDVFIAVCESDETNMVACLTAKRLGARHTVARIRKPEYVDEIDLIKNELDIDLVINPEYTTASQLLRLLRYPNALDIETFFRGQVEIAGFRVLEEDFLTGEPLSAVQKKLGKSRVLFCAVERAGKTLIPDGKTVIEAGDKVYIIGDVLGVNEFFRTLGRISQKIRSVMIVGGGKTSYYLAKLLADMKLDVKIIERDRARCMELSSELPEALILNGDGTQQEVLITENIAKTDGFIALTGDDEDNLIISLYAKQLGVPKVISKINRRDYYDVISSLDIDSFVNPKLITAYTILHYVRGLTMSHSSKMEALYQIAGGTVEAAEFLVAPKTRHLGKPLKDLKLKKGILIVSLMREGKIIIPEGSTSILAGDCVIIVSGSTQISSVDDIFAD